MLKTEIGIRNVTRRTRKRLIPSMPTLYEIPSDGNHGMLRTNCISAVVSKPEKSLSERKNTTVVTMSENVRIAPCGGLREEEERERPHEREKHDETDEIQLHAFRLDALPVSYPAIR